MKKSAHKKEDGALQSIEEHLAKTAELASENAAEPFKETAHALGAAHDIGKYADAFQKRLSGANISFEHSACGAIEYRELLNKEPLSVLAPLMEFCIACHHTGLQDGGSLKTVFQCFGDGTMNPRITAQRKSEYYIGDRDYSDYKSEISLEIPDFSELFKCLTNEKTPSDRIELYAFFTRYLFSCLVDADFLDTERFCEPQKERGLTSDLKAAGNALNKKLLSFKADTELQKARSRIQAQAFKNADKSDKISILNMPTGSGKTLCSLKLALDKLNSDKTKKRIIYVIPYTGIIEQTADEFQKIFGDKTQILQHHSNYVPENSDKEIDTEAKIKLACENWDAPVVITTAVQFFESLYHYRTSALRKLHNMADSVIVFDEIHTLPAECLQPCLRAIGYITKYLNSEAIFLSATMPDYSELFEKYAPDVKINELITDKSDFGFFKKVDFTCMKCDFETVVQKTGDFKKSLIITNTKRSAREMFGLITGNKYHLSNDLTPRDRKAVIEKIRRDLENNVPLTVVSTSLIEAGIDLDFEAVFRELNGLDSILQAAGRCNREGILEKGKVFVFDTGNIKASDIRTSSARRLIEKFEDISSPECIRQYYNDVFFFNKELIEKNSIAVDCRNPAELPFKSYAESFRLIRQETIGVIVPQDDECNELLKKLRFSRRDTMRSLQKYTVSLKCRGENSEFSRALNSGVIRETSDGVFVLTDLFYYDPQTGLDIDKSCDVLI